MMTTSNNNKRKQYSRFIPYLCHFCGTLYKKEELRLIQLKDTQTTVKICLKCISIIDPHHEMETEELK